MLLHSNNIGLIDTLCTNNFRFKKITNEVNTYKILEENLDQDKKQNELLDL